MAIQKTSTFLWLSKLAMKSMTENICLNYVCSTDCSVVSIFLQGGKKRQKEKKRTGVPFQSSPGAKSNLLFVSKELLLKVNDVLVCIYCVEVLQFPLETL